MSGVKTDEFSASEFSAGAAVAAVVGAGAPATATLILERTEGAALVSACLTILTDLINGDGRDLFPDVARPLFSSYTKLCALSNHKVDPRVLRVAQRTWGGWRG